MPPRKPRSSHTGRATMADVARAAGTSAMTVSRALRSPERVGEELRRRIEDAARQLGYVPNRAASALASARSMTVAVLVPSLENVLFINTLSGIRAVLDQHGYQMLIGVTGYAPADEERLLRTHLEHDPDGVILTGLDHAPGAWDLLRAFGVPNVHMMELADPAVWSVGFSQFDAGAAVARHLIERGRRRIGFVAAQLDPRTLRRGEGFRATLREAGLYNPARELMVPDPSSIALGAELLDRMLGSQPDVDALFFCNDDLAQGAVFRCARLGVAVPQRIAIAGFNDLAGSAWTTPPLTTIATPRHAVGSEAARLLLARIEGREERPRQVDLGFELVVREST